MKTYILYHAPWQLLLIAIFIQSSISYIELPDIGIDWSDKILHFFCYGILSFLMARSFSIAKKAKWRDKHLFWSILFSILYGLTDEIHQGFVMGRSATLGDLLADILGVIVFVLIYKWYTNRHLSTMTD